MAEVRVTCPMCNSELAIGEEHLGKEIECGNCLQPFIAEDPKTKKQPYKMRRTEKDRDDDDEDDRPRKKRKRRRDNDDDDYDYSPPGESGGGGALGVVSLIFGILSFPLMCCCYMNIPAALIGIATGAIGMSNPNSRGLSIAGLALSILSLVIFAGMFMVGVGAQAVNAGRFR